MLYPSVADRTRIGLLKRRKQWEDHLIKDCLDPPTAAGTNPSKLPPTAQQLKKVTL